LDQAFHTIGLHPPCVSICSFVSCNASTTQTTSTAEVTKVEESKKEEDCDDKAKKPVEIKPESISLSGNTGCSLDDAH
jgi:hypothetical protein